MRKKFPLMLLALLLIGSGCSKQKEFSWSGSIAALAQKGWEITVSSEGNVYLNTELQRYGYKGTVQLDAWVVGVDPISGYDAPNTHYSALFYKLNTEAMAKDVYDTLTNSGMESEYKAALFGAVVVRTNSSTAMEVTGGTYATI
jgi:hypothetical protein